MEREHRLTRISLILIILLTILGGFFWLNLILIYGLFELAYRRMMKRRFYLLGQDDYVPLTKLAIASLVIVSIVPFIVNFFSPFLEKNFDFNFYWYDILSYFAGLFVFYGVIQFLFYYFSKKKMKVTPVGKVSLVLSSIFSFGTIWILIFIMMGLFDLLFWLINHFNAGRGYRIRWTSFIGCFLAFFLNVVYLLMAINLFNSYGGNFVPFTTALFISIIGSILLLMVFYLVSYPLFELMFLIASNYTLDFFDYAEGNVYFDEEELDMIRLAKEARL